MLYSLLIVIFFKKNIYLVYSAALLFALMSCSEKKSGELNSPVSDFKDLSAQFAEPSKDYRTAPLYVWNTKVTKERIDETMKGLKDNGFGGIFIHPRPGLVTEYLSDEWFDLYRYTVEKGKELGMNVWIYDENSYPSGFAGGHVPAKMPESYNQGQGLVLKKTDVFPGDTSKYFICLKEENNKYKDVTNEKNVPGEKGNFYLFEKSYYPQTPWYGGFSYVDLLYPGVTQKFIDITMAEGYDKAIGDEYGKTVKGWFTDEPNINPPGGIRWTPDLFEVFQKDWGYDLKCNLHSLYEETGDWKRVRHNYNRTLLQLFIDRWAKPCHDYCEEKNLKFTGHYWEHGWPDIADGGDNMAMYAWHQQPAIDMLFNRFDEVSPQAQFGNVRSVKELRSAANQKGYARTMCETYGGGGWEMTFKDFKRLGDWEYALGVNMMNQHLSHMTISGARKYDYPPVFSDVSPWWDYYKTLNMHYARLSLALSAGDQVNGVLVLEPTTSIWLYFAYGKSNGRYMEIGKSFQSFITGLEKRQVEYDLGSENIIKDCGWVDKQNFVIDKRQYSTVVIPPMTENLEGATFVLLKRFLDNGGKIVSYSAPSYVDGVENKEIKTFFGNEKIIHVQSPDSLLDSVLPLQPKFENNGGDLYHQRRVMEDGQILFLVNSSMEEPCKGSVAIAGGKDAVEMNSLSGEIYDYPERIGDQAITLDYEIHPAGSLLLYVFDEKQKGFSPQNIGDEGEYIPLSSSSPMEISPLGENVLAIDFCDLRTGNSLYEDIHTYNAADLAFKANGFDGGNPWSTSIQYKESIVSRDTFTHGGFEAAYHFIIDGDFDYSAISVVVERADLYTVSVNGETVGCEKGKWWLDREFNVLKIGPLVKKGDNVLAIKASPMRVMAEIEPVYILGGFTVVPIDKGWKIKPPCEAFSNASWKAQGWPFYAGKFSYTKRFNIAKKSSAYRVSVGEWRGTVCEVVVNGASAGIIGLGNDFLDVSKYIHEGENAVSVVVVGSNKNLLGPFHNNPEPGLVSPWHFRDVKFHSSGRDYQQLDYGLKDFDLQEKKNND